MSQPIHITVSFDKNYIQHATVMLHSLLLSNPTNQFIIYIFFNDLDDETKKRIEANLALYPNFSIEWIKFDSSLINAFQLRKGHVNEYTFTRLFIPQILSHLPRIIYLDCDLLVLQDISSLWATDLKAKTLGAVNDPYPFTRHNEIGFPEGKKYFNAGVLLLDIKKWNENAYMQKIVDKLTELGVMAGAWDQDGLNVLLYDDRLELDATWNIQSHDISAAQEAGVKQIKKALSPHIIHFTGNLKPWNFKSSNPYKKEYYKILKQTDFIKSHRPENKTPVNIIRRAVRNACVFMGVMKY